MPVFAVDLSLIRDVLLPDLRLSVGRGLMARVVTAQDGRGSLSIAGYLIDAELPKGVRAGQDLRLEVRDIDAHRVLLQIAEHAGGAEVPSSALPPGTPPPPIPLPGGAHVRVNEDQGESGGSAGRRGGGAQALSLTFDGPGLGPVELRFELDPATLRVTVAMTPGAPLQSGAQAAETLREALAASVERSVAVAVRPRRQSLDLYA